MPSRVISRDGRPVMSRSSNQIVPLLGRRWPVIILTKVVLPAPLAPMMPTVCCGGTATLMSRAAMSEPKRLFQVADGEDRRAHGALRPCVAGAAAANSEPRPSGRNRMVSSSTAPSSICQVPRQDVEGDRAQQLEHERADERRGDRAGAGKDGNEDEFAGRRPVGHVRDRHGRSRARPSAPPMPASVPAITSLRWISRLTEMPRNSRRISLSRTGTASAPATERK